MTTPVTSAWIDVAALLAVARRAMEGDADVGELGTAIDEALTSPHLRSVIGCLAIAGSMRFDQDAMDGVAVFVASLAAQEAFADRHVT